MPPMNDDLDLSRPLRALRRSHPDHRIVLAAPSALAPLVPLIGGVDEVCDVSGPGHVPPLGCDVDVAVNLHGDGPHSIAALHRTDPARLLTHAHPAFPDVYGPDWPDDAHEVRRGGKLIDLSPTEFNLLRYLLTNSGRVVSKAQILERVWNYDFGGDGRIDVQVFDRSGHCVNCCW